MFLLKVHLNPLSLPTWLWS